MSLDEKWSKDKKPLQPVKNESLTCRTCKLRNEHRTVDCKFYVIKPLSVLKGGVCNAYKKE